MSADPASRVRLFDTTLRDGEQSPGASLSSAEKLAVARQLARLRVDVIEAGFPAASPDDLRAVQVIARAVGGADGPAIAALARAHPGDIARAWEGVREAARPRIHTFLATSELHMRYKLDLTPREVASRVGAMVALARSLCADVEFSPEDATRSDPSFLVEVLSVAIAAGATTVNIPDTVGYALPDEYGTLIRRLRRDTDGGDGVVWSVHCHDDLGLATANTLAGLAAGARQAEVTVNGIGERAGNASLEEVVMALHTRAARLGLHTGVATAELLPASRVVSGYTGMVVPANKAVVGENAFAHEAGIHQDGMLKDARTYEIMTPASVGRSRSELVLGKHSGRHAFRVRAEELGYQLDAAGMDAAFARFKALADRKKRLTLADLDEVLRDGRRHVPAVFALDDLQVACGRPGMCTATVRVRGGGGDGVATAAAIGRGPVDATFRAIDQIVGVPATLAEYRVDAVTAGMDALGAVSVRVTDRDGATPADGYGTDSDVIRASAEAYLAALNRLVAATGGAAAAREVG